MKPRTEGQNINSARALQEYLKQPDYQEETVRNLNIQTMEKQKQTYLLKENNDLVGKTSRVSTLQFLAMFIVSIIALIVAILK